MSSERSRRRAWRSWWALLALVGVTAQGGAAEGERSFEAQPFQGKKVLLDGLLKEWQGELVSLGEVLAGSVTDGEPRAAAQLGYDERYLYVAFKLKDDRIHRTPAASAAEDHATLLLAVPKPGGGTTDYSLTLHPGDPGKLPGVVKLRGAPVAGAKLVEAPTAAGLDFEAQIPWSALPETAKLRVGLRAALQYTDYDGGKLKAKLASSRQTRGTQLPALRLESEEALESGLLRPKGLPSEPTRALYGNVAGDGFFERVAQYGSLLTIVGPHYRGGSQYYFGELGVAASGVRELSLKDLNGDGRDEILLTLRSAEGPEYREWLSVLSVGEDDAPRQVFVHELVIATAAGKVSNRVQLVKAGAGFAIEVAQAEASGFEPGAFREPKASDMPSALLPWEPILSRRFEWKGDGFVAVSERQGTPKLKPAAARPSPSGALPAAPPPPRRPSAEELLDQVYALYRKERGVPERAPRFDFVTDVAGGGELERVLVHGLDIVAFGKGYLGGTRYAYITLGFKEAKDVLDVGARDLTGDGKAEIIVRGVLHAKASRELGEQEVLRHALFVYQVTEQGLRRIFAAETGRQLGSQQVLGALAFKPSERGTLLELRAGRAVGWTERSYPFPPDTTAVGGLEPLLLPWSKPRVRRYVFTGERFDAQ